MSGIETQAAWGRLLGGKWKLEILYRLSAGTVRWSALTRSFPEAAPNVLTRQLRQLESEGLISRFVTAPQPPRTVEYAAVGTGAAV